MVIRLSNCDQGVFVGRHVLFSDSVVACDVSRIYSRIIRRLYPTVSLRTTWKKISFWYGKCNWVDVRCKKSKKISKSKENLHNISVYLSWQCTPHLTYSTTLKANFRPPPLIYLKKKKVFTENTKLPLEYFYCCAIYISELLNIFHFTGSNTLP